MSGNTISWTPVKIREDIWQRLDGIAEQQHLQPESLVNTILEEYVHDQEDAQQPSDDAAFLLSMAGMFDTEASRTSEQVHEIVATLIEKKHANLL